MDLFRDNNMFNDILSAINNNFTVGYELSEVERPIFGESQVNVCKTQRFDGKNAGYFLNSCRDQFEPEDKKREKGYKEGSYFFEAFFVRYSDTMKKVPDFERGYSEWGSDSNIESIVYVKGHHQLGAIVQVLDRSGMDEKLNCAVSYSDMQFDNRWVCHKESRSDDVVLYVPADEVIEAIASRDFEQLYKLPILRKVRS